MWPANCKPLFAFQCLQLNLYAAIKYLETRHLTCDAYIWMSKKCQ